MPIGKTLDVQQTYLRLLAYGKPGMAKTTAGASLSKRGKILILNAEGGVKKQPLAAQGCIVENIELWPDSPDQITYDAVEEMYIQLRHALQKAPDSYVAVVIDSMTELSRRLLEEVTGKAAEKAARLGKNREQFQTDISDYGVTSTMMRTLLRRFTDLPIHVVMTALERRDVDDDGLVQYGPAMSPAIANDAAGLVDVVCFYDVQEVGDQTFYIGNTKPTGRRVAKDRFGMLPPKLVDATANRMVAYLDGKLTRENDPRQKAIKDAIAGAVEVAKGDVEKPKSTPVESIARKALEDHAEKVVADAEATQQAAHELAEQIKSGENERQRIGAEAVANTPPTEAKPAKTRASRAKVQEQDPADI